jgi:hypothetical protein
MKKWIASLYTMTCMHLIPDALSFSVHATQQKTRNMFMLIHDHQCRSMMIESHSIWRQIAKDVWYATLRLHECNYCRCSFYYMISISKTLISRCSPVMHQGGLKSCAFRLSLRCARHQTIYSRQTLGEHRLPKRFCRRITGYR